MSGDLISVRILAVLRSEEEREVLRQAANASTFLIDVLEADSDPSSTVRTSN
jgi:hypothetical protein